MQRLHIRTLQALLMTSTMLAPAALSAQVLEEEDTVYLGEIVIRAIHDGGAEDSTISAANSIGSRVPVDVEDQPRSVTIVPRELFEAQGARTMEETVAYSPGIVTESYGQDNRYDEFALRGFESQIGGVFRDGMTLRTVDWASWRTEPFGLESVDIVRGPTSDLYGTNQPGGIINAATKRPSFTFGGEVIGILSNDEGAQIGFDVTGPLSDSVAYRFVGLVNDSGTNFEEVDTGRLYLAPSMTFEPSDVTRFTIYGQYQKDDVGDSYIQVPLYGSFRTNANGTFGPDTYTGNPDYNTIETTQNYIGYEFEHEFNGGLTFVSRARMSKNDWLNQTEYPLAFVNLNSLLGVPGAVATDVDTALLTKFDVDQDLDQNSFDNALQFDFDTGNALGSVAAGVDYYEADSLTDFAFGYRGELNLLTGARTGLLSDTQIPTTELPSQRRTEIEQLGIYVNGHAEINDRFILSGGLRHDDVRYHVVGFNTALTGFSTFDHEINDTFTSGNLGLGYRLTDEWMIYSAISRSFNLPPSGVSSSGDPLEVERSKSVELGVKFASRDERSTFAFSAYNIDKTDVAIATGVPFEFTQADEVTSRGFEIEGAHDFGNGLSLFGSVSYVDATRDNDLRVPRIPKFAAAVYAQYQVPQVDGLSLSLGARRTGSRFADDANTFEVGSVTLFDASIGYEVDDWQFLLAARNLTNEQNIGYCTDPTLPIAGASGGCVYGAGREVSLTVRRRF